MAETKQKYRSRKQVVQDCLESGAISETEAKALNKSIIRADSSYTQGKMYLNLTSCNEVITKDFQDKLAKNALTPTQKKTLHIIRVNNITKPHIDSPEEVANACKKYLEIMVEDGMSPTINGLSLALGINAKRLFAISNGEEKCVSKEVIENVIQMIATSNEVAIRNGGVVGEMFVGKNYHGFKDKSEVEIKQDKAEISDEELADKYQAIDIIDV